LLLHRRRRTRIPKGPGVAAEEGERRPRRRGPPKFTASFGITEIEPGEEPAAALRRADEAPLAAKRSGRDQIVLHEPETPSNAPGGNGTAPHPAEDVVRAERIGIAAAGGT
jgi:hypothetical protein